MLNEDYKEMLLALSEEKVRFLLVGAYALAAHGYPRATMDIDIWVMPSPQNAAALLRALRQFGASKLGEPFTAFLRDEGFKPEPYQIGFLRNAGQFCCLRDEFFIKPKCVSYQYLQFGSAESASKLSFCQRVAEHVKGSNDLVVV